MNTSLKIAVLHDAFLYRGGGERLVTLMAKALGADLISGFFSEGSFHPRELGFEWAIIPLGAPVFRKWIRHLVLRERFRKKAYVLADYDIVIFSGNCLGALKHVRADAKVYYYCHTPPRYLFDFREQYMDKFPRIIRPIMNWIFNRQAKEYIAQLERFDMVFTNSINTHDRLLHFCQKESTILYPPTDTAQFCPQGDEKLPKWFPGAGEYFLSTSRLSPPKRVDMVIEAFRKTPKKNLVFTYGKNDPEKDRLLALAEWCRNIFPMPAPSDAVFISLVANAIAMIYIPVDEDFGMSPVESMACGVPVIGANEWGLKETVIEGKTGTLIDITPESGVKRLQMVLEEVSLSDWQNMHDDCRKRAEEFSLESFSKNLKKFIEI